MESENKNGKVPLISKIAYGFGDVGCNFSWMFVSNFLMIFNVFDQSGCAQKERIKSTDVIGAATNSHGRYQIGRASCRERGYLCV